MIAFFTFLGLSLLFLTAPGSLAGFNANRQNIGLAWAIGTIAMGLLGIAMPLAASALLISTAWRALKGANQRIETSAAGIVFTDGARWIEARWDQIVKYGVPREKIKSVLNSGFYVRTRDAEFSFNPYLRRHALLIQIIRHWAPEEASEMKTADREDLLGSEAQRWTGGYPGIGERIHHYRTRTNRAFLGFLVFSTIAPLGARALEQSLGVPQPPLGAGLEWCVVAALFAGTLWAGWRFRAARIEIDGSGLMERSAFGARRLAWDNIRQYSAGEWIVTIKGDGETIRFWQTISFCDDLKREIARRAVNSVNKGWDTI